MLCQLEICWISVNRFNNINKVSPIGNKVNCLRFFSSFLVLLPQIYECSMNALCWLWKVILNSAEDGFRIVLSGELRNKRDKRACLCMWNFRSESNYCYICDLERTIIGHKVGSTTGLPSSTNYIFVYWALEKLTSNDGKTRLTLWKHCTLFDGPKNLDSQLLIQHFCKAIIKI